MTNASVWLLRANHDHCLHTFLLKECGSENNAEEIRDALFFAIGHGYVSCVRLLLDFHTVDVNQIQNDGIAPLHMSAGAGQLDIMRELVQRGADIDLPLERDCLIPLHVCAYFGFVDCLRFLLQSGADSRKETSETGMNALHFAAHHGHLECIAALLEHGCDINATSHTSHRSALHFALRANHKKCFQLLVEGGADTSLLDINKHSALFCLPLDPTSLDHQVLSQFSLGERRRWFTYSVVDVERPSFHLQQCPRGHLWQHLKENFSAVSSGMEPVDKDEGCLFERLPYFEVSFLEEIGHGAGVRKEWFSQLEKELDCLPILEHCESGKTTLAPTSAPNDDILHAQMIGTILALSLVYGYAMPFDFPSHILKSLLGLPFSLEDVRDIDPDLWTNKFNTLSDYSDHELKQLNLTFSLTQVTNGELVEIELAEGGAHRNVCVSDVKEYLQHCMTHLFDGGGRKEIREAFASTFHRYVPQQLLQALFSLEELSDVLRGERHISVDEWATHTRYELCSPEDEQIEWFWKLVKQLTPAQHRILLSFCTGSPSLPLGGFKRLKEEQVPFTLSLQRGLASMALPTTHTCFNTLVIPRYDSLSTMARCFQMALEAQEVGAGFLFA